MCRLLPMIALAVAVVATGCGGGDGTASPTNGATATQAGTLAGTLAGDAQLEGGCIWLEPTGAPADDVATTCQTGMPYRVDEVLGFVGR